MPDTRRDDPRLDLLRHWLESELGWMGCGLAPASADASFRRYFRVSPPGGTLVAMDAPPAGKRGALSARRGISRPSGSMCRGCSPRTPMRVPAASATWARTTYLAALDDAAAGGLYLAALDRAGGDPGARPGPRRVPCRPTTSAARARDQPVSGLVCGAPPRNRARRGGHRRARRRVGPHGGQRARPSRRCTCTATTIRAT